MEIQEIVAQFVKAAAEDPSHLEQFGIDPGEAIKNATGLEVSDEQMGDIVGAVEPLLEGKGLDMGKAMEAVGDFLGGDELLGKLSGLFGGKSWQSRRSRERREASLCVLARVGCVGRGVSVFARARP